MVGALRDSSPRQHSTPKPDFKMATMRQNIQVPENCFFFVSCFAVVNVDICFHQSHIQAGRIEAAFQAALSASDLQMVNCFTFTTHHQHQVKVTNYMLILKTSNLSFFPRWSLPVSFSTPPKSSTLQPAPSHRFACILISMQSLQFTVPTNLH